MQQSFDPQRFRQALGAFTTGVTIVTTVDAAGADVGMTANSFNSVSLTPPLVLWSIGRNSTNVEAFLAAKHFAVHILASDQDSLATRFATKNIDRFEGLKLERGAENIPLIEGVAARFECRTAFQYEGGDHVIIVGEVLALEHWDRDPLVFKRGRYALAVGKSGDAAAPAAQPVTPGAFEQDFLVYLLGRAYHQLYARIKPELGRRQLAEPEYQALSLLGVRDGLSVAELDAMLAYTGIRVDDQVAQRLQTQGLVRTEADGRLALTDAGRRTVVELLETARGACSEGEKSFDAGDKHALRQLLQRVIESTDPGIPHPWQR